MPIVHVVHSDLSIFVVTCSGTVTLREILEFLDAIESDPLILDGMLKFLDCRAISAVSASDAEIAGVAELMQSLDKRRTKTTPMIVFAPDGEGLRAGQFYAGQFRERAAPQVVVHRDLASAAAAARIDPAILGARLDPPVSPDEPR